MIALRTAIETEILFEVFSHVPSHKAALFSCFPFSAEAPESVIAGLHAAAVF